MANLKIVAVTTNGGAQYDDYSVFINENIETGTIVGKITGWESLPNFTFRVHQEGGVDQDIGGRYEIKKIGNEYFLVVKNGGTTLFDYEDDNFGGMHQQMWFEAVDASNKVIHTAIFDVYLNDLVETPNTAPSAPAVQGTVATVNENQAGPLVVATVASTDDGIGGGSVSYAFATNGNPGNLFSINATTGQITFSGQGQDFENNPLLQTDTGGKFFTVQVVAKDGPGLTSAVSTVKVYLNNVNEAPNTPNYSSNGPINETSGVGTVVGSLTATDPDGTTPSFVFADTGTTTSADGAFKIVLVGGTYQVQVADPAKIQVTSGTSKTFTYNVQASDGSLKSGNGTISITVNDVASNQPPGAPAVQGTVATVNENQAGPLVVATVASTDDGIGGGSVSYAFATNGNPGNLFSINATTGQIIFSGQGQDFENNPLLQSDGGGKFFTVQVVATDGPGLTSAVSTVKVYLNNVNEAPNTPNYSSNGPINETSGVGTVVGSLTATDPDGTTPSFVFADTGTTTSADGAFKIVLVGGTYQVQVADATKIQVTSGTSKTFTYNVQASDGSLKSGNGTISITVNDVASNQPPGAPAVQGTVATVNENQAGPLVVATVASTDDGIGGGGVSYAFATNGNPGNLFSINATTGQITFSGQGQDFENNPLLQSDGGGKFFTVQVVAKDGPGLTSAVSTVKVYLNNVNEAPNTPNYTSNGAINETVSPDTVVGTLTATDPDGTTPSFVFAETGTTTSADGAFKIVLVGGTYQVQVADATKIQVTSGTSKTFTYNVQATDGSLKSGNTTVSVTVNNVDKPPAITIDGPTTFEATDTGSVVSPFKGVTISDPDSNTLTVKITYARADGVLSFLVGGSNVSYTDDLGNRTYTISGSKDYIKAVLEGILFDPTDVPGATTPSLKTTNFHISVTDDTNTVTNTQIKVDTTVTSKDPGNHAPYYLAFLNGQTIAAVDENVAGAQLGVLKGLDQDLQDVLTYRIVADPSGKFEIVSTTNGPALKLKDGQSLDYETATSHIVAVMVDDGHGGTYTQNFTINVGNVNDTNASPVLASRSISVRELTANNTSIATLAGTDANQDPLTYSLVVGGKSVMSDGRFYISGNQLKVQNGVLLDAEQSKLHKVVIRVSDGKGGYTDAIYSIGVADRNPETMTAAQASKGNDILKGSKTGNYKDVFYGGAGNDKLWGGYGNDTLWGGTGKDVFVFDGKLGTSKTDRSVNFDTIKDYSVKDDSIWLENSLFKGNKTLYAKIKNGTEKKPVKLDKKFFTIGDKAKDKDDYFVYDSKKRVLSYDADGSGSKAAIEIAKFDKAQKSFQYSELFFI